MIVFIFITCSPSLYAGEKSKAGSPAVKDQRIAVTPIDSEELNFCGNRAGGFGALYQGNIIRITYGFGNKILANFKGTPKEEMNILCEGKLGFLNTQIEVVGYWGGKDVGDVESFEVKKMFIPQHKKSKPQVL